MRSSPTARAAAGAQAAGMSIRKESPMKSLVLLVCLCPGLASAGTLYRCVGAGGQVSYQAKPCAAGQRMDRTIEFAAVPDSQPMATTSRGKRSSATGARSSRGSRRAGTSARPKPDPCLQAKAKREQRLAQLGLKRTLADLSRLDEPVRAACRGF
jgi:hypothetical protein